MDKHKHTLKIVSFIILILLGIFLFFYGGYDDSPGAQLLGLLVVIFSIISLVRLKKKS
jgi:drug/metabolite transporter (DMT)-like permease